jgi:hypothetical protein
LLGFTASNHRSSPARSACASPVSSSSTKRSALFPFCAAPQKTWTNISDTVSTVINFYIWLLTSIWAAVSSLAGNAGDMVGGLASGAGDMINGSATSARTSGESVSSCCCARFGLILLYRATIQ